MATSTPSSAPAKALAQVVDSLLAAKGSGREVGQLVHQGSALLIELRQREEARLGACAEQSQPLSAAKTHVEGAEAQMVELRYQRSQHVRGIATCRDDTRRAASLHDLIDAEQLSALRPYWSAARDSHQLMLQRLALEYEERRALCERRDAIKEDARKLRKQLLQHRALEAAVAKEVDGIVSAALATQAQLPQQPSVSTGSVCEAPIPLPLHSLRTAAQAFTKAYGLSLVLSTCGLPAEGGNTPAGSVPPHPLGVTLRASSSRGGGGCLVFSYYPTLELIAVSASPPTLAAALRDLVKGDDGSTFPNENCLLRALQATDVSEGGESEPKGGSKVGSTAGSEGHLTPSSLLGDAAPFKWAQRMGGFGPPLREHEVQFEIAFKQVLELLSRELLAASA